MVGETEKMCKLQAKRINNLHMNNFTSKVSLINNDKVMAITVDNGSHTAFAGVADNNVINNICFVDRMSELLIRAVNNRTRERNYFRLYNQLLENEISEQEFDKEIEDHEDDYVVSNNEEADLSDIKTALFLSQQLKDVKDVDDMSDIFSFSNRSMIKSLEENNG